ncbi:hypothetical protein Agabi119p4_10012 [Agaricus bisporus var. burnettii]|uniref:Uncharacterized protein n=1 Tax=Agaricus bisporus var. burnettii TaxID=192524 RepID=A0A8H7C4P6_AGABI|nr:hypothetical protein Agabi119p4_10012 [Agaricus bisporus var. burnettii]
MKETPSYKRISETLNWYSIVYWHLKKIIMSNQQTTTTQTANFGGCLQRLLTIHTDITDLLQFQSNVQLPLFINPPSHIDISDEEKNQLEAQLETEKRLLKLIENLLRMAKANNREAKEALSPGSTTWTTNNDGWE